MNMKKITTKIMYNDCTIVKFNNKRCMVKKFVGGNTQIAFRRLLEEGDKDNESCGSVKEGKIITTYIGISREAAIELVNALQSELNRL